MDKSGARLFRYDQCPTPAKNGKTPPLVSSERDDASDARCPCRPGVMQGVFSNLGICALLVGYTLLGSFVFLAIEGGGGGAGGGVHQRTLARSSAAHNSTFRRLSAESRARTVENIWDITVSLNILYRDNWTRLAAQEIARFQEQLVQRLGEEMAPGAASDAALERRPLPASAPFEWNFARAFLYSLTVLTTIGYGSLAPHTALGRAVTMLYATLGIPLMLVYLSSAGALLSRCARAAASRALCCCACARCYGDERLRAKERRMSGLRDHPEPFYVRATPVSGNVMVDGDVTGGGDGGGGRRDGSILTPVALCVALMLLYIVGGAATLVTLEAWTFVDGCYFCFMSLSTIGFGAAAAPGAALLTGTVWFCSGYILTGMALTAMCFNILHDEIVHRLRHQGIPTSGEKSIVAATPS